MLVFQSYLIFPILYHPYSISVYPLFSIQVMIWELRQYNAPYIVVRPKIGIECTSMTFPSLWIVGETLRVFSMMLKNDFINYNTASLNNKQIYHCYEVWFKFDIAWFMFTEVLIEKLWTFPLDPLLLNLGVYYKHT